LNSSIFSVVKFPGFLTGLPFGIALSDHWKRNLLITRLLLETYLGIVSGAARSFFRRQRLSAHTNVIFTSLGSQSDRTGVILFPIWVHSKVSNASDRGEDAQNVLGAVS